MFRKRWNFCDSYNLFISPHFALIKFYTSRNGKNCKWKQLLSVIRLHRARANHAWKKKKIISKVRSIIGMCMLYDRNYWSVQWDTIHLRHTRKSHRRIIFHFTDFHGDTSLIVNHPVFTIGSKYSSTSITINTNRARPPEPHRLAYASSVINRRHIFKFNSRLTYLLYMYIC